MPELKLIIRILLTLGLAAFCGWMWRIGGSSKYHARWVRMAGTDITEFLGLLVWFGFSPWIFLTSGLAWTECTYFKSKGAEAKWWNWLLCGIQYALIPLPLVFLGIIHWQGFVDRSIVIIPVITLWRTFWGNVDWSEGGAGAWQILTLPLLSLHKIFFIN